MLVWPSSRSIKHIDVETCLLQVILKGVFLCVHRKIERERDREKKGERERGGEMLYSLNVVLLLFIDFIVV